MLGRSNARWAQERDCLVVEGALTSSATQQLRETAQQMLADPDRVFVYLDLSGVTLVDAAGFGVLVGLRRFAGDRVVIVDPSPAVRRAALRLRLTGFLGLAGQPMGLVPVPA